MDAQTFRNAFNRLIRPLELRIRLMISRAVVEYFTDTTQFQSAQVSLLADEVQDDVEVFQQYGFTSVPFKGAEGIALCVGGTRGHALLINCGNREYRLTGLQEGEVALYTDEGVKLHFKRGKVVELSGADQVNVIASKINLGAENPSDAVALGSKVLGELNKLQQSVNSLIGDYNSHTHDVAGTINVSNGSCVGTAAPTKSTATPAANPSSVASAVVESQ